MKRQLQDTKRHLIALSMLTLASVSTSVRAQEIRGTVVEANDTTLVSGAVVLLLHTAKDSIFARIVTGDRGTFSLRAPVATPVRLRVLRLGFQPTNAGTFTVAAGQTETVRVKLAEKRIVLATFDVASTKRCDVRPDSALLVAQLYEEARKALLASATAVSNMQNEAQFTLYSRAQDQRGKLVAPIERSSYKGPSSRPFASVSADSLAKVGYVVEEPDGTVYRAPDADILLSDSFLQAHCLQLVAGSGERSASIGIGFKPVKRGKLIEVRGTLWLDRESNELQYLEYQYVGINDDYTRAGVGGRVDYTQMSDGLWFANKWAIHMPRFEARMLERVRGMRATATPVAEFDGLQITGGEVQWLKVDDELLYSNAGAALAGSEPRDLQNLSVTAGRFEVEGTAEKIGAASPAIGIDTLLSMSSCADMSTDGYTGQVRGRLRDLNQRRADSVPVVAEWKEDFRVSGQRDFVWQFRRLETRTNANGDYVFCGLPIARAISLSAVNGGRKSRVALVRLTQKAARASMDLSIGDHIGSAFTVADSKLKGGVLFVVDPFGVPIAYATVSLGSNNMRVANRDGRINLSLAPRDTLRLDARKIGYQPFNGKVARDSANGAFRVTLNPIAQNLKTVTVNDRLTLSPLERTGFYDRMHESQRGAVVGEFFTPEEIEARPAAKLTQFLEASRYLDFRRSQFSTLIVGRGGCPVAIVLDGFRVRGIIDVAGAEASGTVMDVNALVSMTEVHAIEVYPSANLAPAAISSQVRPREGMCGIVALWTGGRGRQ